MPQQIRDRLWLGDVTDAINTAALKKLEISAICCLAPDTAYWTDPVDYKDFSRQVFSLNDGEEIPHWILDEALTWIEEKMEEGQSVLVHCAAGISRSPGIVIAYLMSHGMTWDTALDDVRSKRPVAMPHPEIKKSILKFFSHFPYSGEESWNQ